jgi:magnesium-dependent phosphatase 1
MEEQEDNWVLPQSQDSCLIVFDLDLTLWHCGEAIWVECMDYSSLRMNKNNVVDKYGGCVTFFEDFPKILELLQSSSWKLGVASRTPAIKAAREVLRLSGVGSYFEFMEIYPSSKVQHFHQLREQSKIPFERMLFFDDEERNIREVGELGVTCIPVADGITLELLQNGIKQFHLKLSNLQNQSTS